jgi:peptide/nickel transport system permease protein
VTMSTASAMSEPNFRPTTPQRRPLLLLAARAWRQGRTKTGISIVSLLVLAVVAGPFVAPHSPLEFVGPPFSHPTKSALLGTDSLGRDVLSRFLWGGRSVLGLALAATFIGVGLGTILGLVAAYSRSIIDDVLMRAMDVILAFPSIMFALVAVSTVGPKLWLLVVAVGVTTLPRVARVIRGDALEIVEQDFVDAAEAIGIARQRILISEVLPNVTGSLMVQASLQLTYAVGLIAGLSFLGFGVQPPAADWGLMINENRQGLSIQPLGVAMPIFAIALLTIATSLIGDGISRASAGIDGGAAE